MYTDYILTPEARERAVQRGDMKYPPPDTRDKEAERTRTVAELYRALPRNLRRKLLDVTGLDGHRVRHHVRKMT